MLPVIKWSGTKAADFAKQAAEATLEASKEGGDKAVREVRDTIKGFVAAWKIAHEKKNQGSK